MLRRTLSSFSLAALTLSLAATVSPPAEAFCGFYVAPSDAPLYADATMVALMREENRTVLSMSNNYRGPAADFAMVVPVPVVLHKENVKTLPKSVFSKLESLSAPRLVEYWEQDPCLYGKGSDKAVARAAAPMSAGASGGGGGGRLGVTVEAQFAVGEYDVVILSAKESDGLETWLTENHYNIPKGAAAALAPYVREQMKFFVAKVDVKKVEMNAEGVAVLSPLRVAYESADFRLPLRLGLLNAKDKQDLVVYLLSKKGRFEAANYPNVFVPTNLDVVDETRNAFGSFYAELFDSTMKKAGGKAVVTEYSWASGSCDPCPTPPLVDSDIATLGGDVLYGMGAPASGEDDGTAAPGVPGGPPAANRKGIGGRMSPGGMGGYYGGTTQQVTLTRLHTRYDASTLGEDIVFRQADPVVGGREMYAQWGKSDTLEHGALPAKYGGNNFQARYAIRHPWSGKIECEHPVRGMWGGPPNGEASRGASAATGLAGAPRGKVQLASMVASPIPELDVKPVAARADANASDVDRAGRPPAHPRVERPLDEPATPPSAWEHGGVGTGPGAVIGLFAALAVAGVTLTIAARTRK